ncbi:DEAD/DEAH box helicase [Neoactinobaculum massilliense]|uniref:DEAD/DEAH box helicase n=1 Tax=Neoactinobaculum massilliense TaxID=2364794 RepID=UPI001F15296E|nr:DEAD/DEAH box helicase [Neoactinobaculum massilliense]
MENSVGSGVPENAITFDSLGLPEDIRAAVADMGFKTPTAIQAQTIPLLLEGRDVIGVAQTGTGKTAAFSLPLLARVDPENTEVQALVMAPTRELAMQGAQAIEDFASHSRGVRVLAVYGGSPYGPQLHALKDGVQVVVGTPGRIMDLMDRGALKLSHVTYFVLDEADEMLRMGFAEDVEKIAAELPAEGRVSALFSATMPKSIRRIADQHLHNPAEISVTPPASTVSTVLQTYAVVPTRHKVNALARVLAVSKADAALVFVRTRATAEELALELGSRGVATAALSGDVAQKDRERLVSRLRNGTLDVLVATDVAARGLDVERIGLVVNYDVPREADTYVHRIGRTGRAGRHGRSLTFVTPREISRLRRIAKMTKSEMTEVDIPTAETVFKTRAEELVQRAITRVGNGRLDVYRQLLSAFDTAGGNRADLLAGLLALGVRDPGPVEDEVPNVIKAGRRDHSDRDRPRRKERTSSHRSLQHAKRYRIEVGHKDHVKPGAIVGALTGEGGLAGSDLGHIDIYPTFSLVEIGVPLDTETRHRISEATVSGRALRISEDHGPERRGGRFHKSRRPRRD